MMKHGTGWGISRKDVKKTKHAKFFKNFFCNPHSNIGATMNHDERMTVVERIRDKLKRARKADRWCRRNGAKSHRYVIGPTLTEEEIVSLENQYEVSLPEEYRDFLLYVGNGGVKERGFLSKLWDTAWNPACCKNSVQRGAGPHYGFYPLQTSLECVAKIVGKPCLAKPIKSRESWEDVDNQWEIFKRPFQCHEDNDEEWDHLVLNPAKPERA